MSFRLLFRFKKKKSFRNKLNQRINPFLLRRHQEQVALWFSFFLFKKISGLKKKNNKHSSGLGSLGFERIWEVIRSELEKERRWWTEIEKEKEKKMTIKCAHVYCWFVICMFLCNWQWIWAIEFQGYKNFWYFYKIIPKIVGTYAFNMSDFIAK